ncbi:MAG TPA: hypothetical protein VNH18_08980 [Bryobacteraceae bacterium]|nr:hypothetical protein [Bryobacteraceae bacterium]
MHHSPFAAAGFAPALLGFSFLSIAACNSQRIKLIAECPAERFTRDEKRRPS